MTVNGTSKPKFPKGDHLQGEPDQPVFLERECSPLSKCPTLQQVPEERPQPGTNSGSCSLTAKPSAQDPAGPSQLPAWPENRNQKLQRAWKKSRLQLRQMILICKAFETSQGCGACHSSHCQATRDMTTSSWEDQPCP